MAQQVVQQKSRGFICINSHPAGCAREVERQIQAVRALWPEPQAGPRRALVIGSSTGYGLASRIALAWGFGASTLGVFFEKEPSAKRTATAGFYNTAAMQARARADGLWAEGINGDAFSDEIKQQAADRIRSEFGQVDLVIYSLASPRRTDPRGGETHVSSLKTIGEPYAGKSIDLATRQITEARFEPASEAEIASTVAVMGGEDWRWWIEKLADENLLAPGARTLAYSYVGPEVTWPIYRGGTIGRAKQHLERTAGELRSMLSERVGGGAWVSVNKAVVTQALAAIPVVPLYMSLLLKVMKEKQLHEGTIEQMLRLCADHLAEGKTPSVDSEGLIRLDDREMSDEVQAEIKRLWPQVTSENLLKLADFTGFHRDFNRLFGFEVEGVDYAARVETEVPL